MDIASGSFSSFLSNLPDQTNILDVFGGMILGSLIGNFIWFLRKGPIFKFSIAPPLKNGSKEKA